jgi:hypothetical protein
MVLPKSVGEEIAREVSTEDLLFPVFDYHLDESDPDILVLRRQDDTFVASAHTGVRICSMLNTGFREGPF